MRVHPFPKKRSITLRYGANASFSAPETTLSRQKKLRRLPHIFSQVLELPLPADADVFVAEDPECFRFVVPSFIGFDGGVETHAIETYPGVMKVVIRQRGAIASLDLNEDDLELDRWRFRLPPSTRPALATSKFSDGDLIVTIPKDSGSNDSKNEKEEDLLGADRIGSDINRLVLVR